MVFGLYVYSIVQPSVHAWSIVGWHFFSGTNWNFGIDKYGALPLIVGTLLTAGLAILVAGPVGVGAALAIVYVIPRRARLVVSSIVELLAFVPSVVYGVWGFIVVAPWLENTA